MVCASKNSSGWRSSPLSAETAAARLVEFRKSRHTYRLLDCALAHGVTYFLSLFILLVVVLTATASQSRLYLETVDLDGLGNARAFSPAAADSSLATGQIVSKKLSES